MRARLRQPRVLILFSTVGVIVNVVKFLLLWGTLRTNLVFASSRSESGTMARGVGWVESPIWSGVCCTFRGNSLRAQLKKRSCCLAYCSRVGTERITVLKEIAVCSLGSLEKTIASTGEPQSKQYRRGCAQTQSWSAAPCRTAALVLDWLL